MIRDYKKMILTNKNSIIQEFNGHWDKIIYKMITWWIMIGSMTTLIIMDQRATPWTLVALPPLQRFNRSKNKISQILMEVLVHENGKFFISS